METNVYRCEHLPSCLKLYFEGWSENHCYHLDAYCSSCGIIPCSIKETAIFCQEPRTSNNPCFLLQVAMLGTACYGFERSGLFKIFLIHSDLRLRSQKKCIMSLYWSYHESYERMTCGISQDCYMKIFWEMGESTEVQKYVSSLYYKCNSIGTALIVTHAIVNCTISSKINQASEAFFIYCGT